MHRSSKAAAVGVALIGCAFSLQGCGGGGGGGNGPSPVPSGSNPHCTYTDSSGLCSQCQDGYMLTGPQKICLYACSSSLQLGPVKDSAKKGMMMDDTTHHWCPDSLHSMWANTAEPIQSIRIAKAWEADWPADKKQVAWNSIATFLHATGAKALVGTSITCSTTGADDDDWKDVLTLLKLIGPGSVMGVAIGNELDLLWQQGASAECLKTLWYDGSILKKFNSRAADLDKLGSEWQSIKLTSPFSEYIFAGNPFVDLPGKAMVNTFVFAVLKAHGDRWVFSLNNYPYFDTGNALDPGSGTCTGAITSSTCFDQLSCKFENAVNTMRTRMTQVSAAKNLLWVTETGWSSPMADNMKWPQYQMAHCAAFSSLPTMQTFYGNFLKWDITNDATGPDHVFFFGMRDSSNFGQTEHFGLGGSGDPTKLCVNTTCKMQAPSKTSLVV